MHDKLLHRVVNMVVLSLTSGINNHGFHKSSVPSSSRLSAVKHNEVALPDDVHKIWCSCGHACTCMNVVTALGAWSLTASDCEENCNMWSDVHRG